MKEPWVGRGTCRRLGVQKRFEAAWHFQVTAGCGGHTCRHAVTLLACWRPGCLRHAKWVCELCGKCIVRDPEIEE
ncbi:hypothetical protein AOLI_G00082500 [Acnodon oligacanthus]